MGKSPSLITLCLDAIKDTLLRGDGDCSHVYELPSELFDILLPRLPPLALQELQEQLPLNTWDDCEPDGEYITGPRKRKRACKFNKAWRDLYNSRWRRIALQNRVDFWLGSPDSAEQELTNDRQQLYWEAHLQNCLDAATEKVSLPSHVGCVGDVQIPDTLLEYIGYVGHLSKSCDYSKFSSNCEKFGSYARSLRLPSVLCIAEICFLLRSSKLERLELRWIRSEEHVSGLCKLLNQNCGTLKSVKFIHCKFSSSSLNAICDSLLLKDSHAHGIRHFSIKTSNFIQTSPNSVVRQGSSFPIPPGLFSLLSLGRSLSSFSLCDCHIQKNFAKVVFSTLLDASSGIAILDLSENNISGWLSHFDWRSANFAGKSLQSLRVLNLRNSNLCKDDMDCLKYALLHMPNVESLDLSDNPIEDDGLKTVTSCFMELSEGHFSIIDLKLENCELTCGGVNQLLAFLSTLERPLKTFGVGGNELGSEVGRHLGKFLHTGLRALHIEDIGLGPSGFLDMQEELVNDLKLVYINISKNRGGIQGASFLSKLISKAPGLVAINAGYNFMPAESFSVICSRLKVARGKLEHLDLTGNSPCGQSAEALLAEYCLNGTFVLKLPSFVASGAPYDDDP